jgi:hypothetical protein
MVLVWLLLWVLMGQGQMSLGSCLWAVMPAQEWEDDGVYHISTDSSASVKKKVTKSQTLARHY